MARRRMISQDLISDPHYNELSLEAQNIFIRMLTVSDDCGVVPANLYRLNVLINTPKRIAPKLGSVLDEIQGAGLGYLFDFKEERFFAFKPAAFQDYQSYILKKATKSEYLRIPVGEYEELSKNFQELPRISSRFDQTPLSTVESRKQKVESRKQKVESKEQKVESKESVEVPAALSVVWGSFRSHRREIKSPMTPRAERLLLKELAAVPVDTAVKMIEQSIRNGWKGIFELKGSNGTHRSGTTHTSPAGAVKADISKYDHLTNRT